METASPIQYLDLTRTNETIAPIVCYAPTMLSIYGVWRGESPLDYSVPLFIVQLLLIIATTRITAFILQPLRFPRYIYEIIGGFILGPTVLGKIPYFSMTIFPVRSLVILESIAYLGLVYSIFIMGVEVEHTAINNTATKSLLFAFSCLVGPLTIGLLCGIPLRGCTEEGMDQGAFLTFLGVVLSVTAFSVLARILGELKLIGSEIGRLALSSAIMNDSVAWIVLSLSVAMSHTTGNLLGSLWTVLSGIFFAVVNFLIVRAAIMYAVRHTPEGEEVDELYECMILVGVLVAAMVADTFGTHPVFGAFAYGVAVPNGPLGEALIEKVEDFVTGLLLPLFFVLNGMRMDVSSVKETGTAAALVAVIFTAALAKVGGGVFAATLYKMPVQDGLVLGLLMNTKGVIELIILTIGREKRIITSEAFTILVITSIIVTALISPLLTALARHSRRFVAYKRRTIRWPNPESELRILACVHHPRDVPSLITLLDISNPTKRSPIYVYALQLIELTGRAATLLVSRTTSRDSSSGAPTRLRTQSEHIVHAFENYEQHAGGVSVQNLTAFSPYATMHEDVCGAAEDKHVALILLPFHKHQTVDGFMEVTHPAIRSLNQNALSSAPCSVAILIDRNLTAMTAKHHRAALHVALIFFGGPDDREALAYTTRMAGHLDINLSLLRFIPGIFGPSPSPHERVVTMTSSDERERRLDEACLEELKARWGDGEFEYRETVSCNAEETITGIRGMMEGDHDLYIVGRAYGVVSPLTAGLTEWSECSELGTMGDLLSSSDFGAEVSVLVVQQGRLVDGMVMPDSPGRQVRVCFNKDEFRSKGIGGI